ncbi:MAG: hypothetical protein KDN22_32035 [Verrucomicrobiae bacterium]|nr:hypothetical protein [Verrucomicrobiae bacterium]
MDLEATAFLDDDASPPTDIQTGRQTFTFAFGSYAQWQAHHFTNLEIASGKAALNAAPAGGTTVNLIEYAYGLNPTKGDVAREFDAESRLPVGLPKIRVNQSLNGAAMGVTVEFPCRTGTNPELADPQIHYVVEFSEDNSQRMQSSDNEFEIIEKIQEWDLVRVTLDFGQPAQIPDSLFCRVRIVLSP